MGRHIKVIELEDKHVMPTVTNTEPRKQPSTFVI